MTDIHSHILPGVDDGAQTLEESSAMLDLADGAGTRAMVATPHADLRYRFRPDHCRELLDRLADRHPDGPRLYLGCELHLTPENITRVIEKPGLYSLNGRGCILLELPDRIMPDLAGNAIEALIDSGLRVIIAHPERNPYIQHRLSYLDRLTEMGCYLQLTARSLSGGFGLAATSAGNYILRRRLAHFIATDAHGATYRKPILRVAFERVSKTYGEESAHLLFADNPEAALSGAIIRQMPPGPGWLTSLFTRTSHEHRKQTVPQMH